jgi:transcriptional regulator with XRE-family HTH domain
MSRNQKARRPQPPRGPFPSLLKWREAHGLNQREAAEVLGWSQTKYSRHERRLQFAKHAEARRLVVATRVPLEVVVGVA